MRLCGANNGRQRTQKRHSKNCVWLFYIVCLSAGLTSTSSSLPFSLFFFLNNTNTIKCTFHVVDHSWYYTQFSLYQIWHVEAVIVWIAHIDFSGSFCCCCCLMLIAESFCVDSLTIATHFITHKIVCCRNSKDAYDSFKWNGATKPMRAKHKTHWRWINPTLYDNDDDDEKNERVGWQSVWK